MTSKRLELFPTIVHQIRLDNHAAHRDACLPVLDALFEQVAGASTQAALETGDAVSTFPIDRRLYLQPEFADVAADLLRATTSATGFEASFVEMWANRHRRGGRTLEHLHGAQICGVYYLSAPEDSGGLIFRSPLEYALCGSPQVDAAEITRVDGVARRLDVEEGMLVLFPGWLKHLTEVSRSDSARIVVSFNLRISGLHDPRAVARSQSA